MANATHGSVASLWRYPVKSMLVATVHLVTTATLDRLHQLYPQGRFEVPRFRPNIVVAPASGEQDFVENAWIGHTLAIGDAVRLSITGPCGRCVMTTLAQGDLPPDPGILRAAAQHNKVSVGIYATVERLAARSAAVMRSGLNRRAGGQSSAVPIELRPDRKFTVKPYWLGHDGMIGTKVSLDPFEPEETKPCTRDRSTNASVVMTPSPPSATI